MIDLKDFDRCEATLNEFERSVRPRPAVIDDIRGDIALERKDVKGAEQFWNAYLGSKPSRANGAATCDKIAGLYVDQSRWRDVLAFRTRALAAQETAERHVMRATAFLRLRDWKNAYAEMHKASALSASDATVEEWLPQFERLEKFLSRIKALDAQIAATPGNAALFLDRARLFTVADRPLLALDDCEEALRLQPNSMRARIQKGEALLDDKRTEDAAKIGVAVQLARNEDKHVDEHALRALATNDALIASNAGAPEPLAARAKVLRDLRQWTLALADARAALALNENMAAAHFEAAHALEGIDDVKEALAHVTRATELDPNDPVKWYYRGLLETKRADLTAAIESQSRSLGLRESVVALRAREENARRIGQVDRANADLQRLQQLAPGGQ